MTKAVMALSIILAIMMIASLVFYPAVGVVTDIDDGITLIMLPDGNVYGVFDAYSVGDTVAVIMVANDRTTATDDVVAWVF